jgi:hypothetical protein
MGSKHGEINVMMPSKKATTYCIKSLLTAGNDRLGIFYRKGRKKASVSPLMLYYTRRNFSFRDNVTHKSQAFNKMAH